MGISKENFYNQAIRNGILEKGKIHELRDDGIYQIWTAGNTVQEKKVLSFIQVGENILIMKCNE